LTVEGKEGVLQASATRVGPNGAAIIFESEVVLSDDGFTETGTITIEGRGSFTFDTIGMGQMAPSPVEGTMHGTIMWNITGGDGEFAGATGRVASNFMFSEAGELTDNQSVRIFTS